MKRAVSRQAAATLPKAPLAEVVFELRWVLHGGQGVPTLFQVDPGYLPAEEAFTAEAAGLGFPSVRNMGGPGEMAGGHAIARRFYVAPDKEFPLLQIGPGIFASNQSSEYSWPSFKDQTLRGIKALLNSYPSLRSFSLKPIYLELRYIDAFDASLVGTIDFVQFLADGTTVELKPPPMFGDATVFSGPSSGRLLIARNLRAWKSSQFSIDLGSGQRKDEPILRSETKVFTSNDGVPALTSRHQRFLTEIEKWLEFAHGVTSPFFKELVSEAAMAKFKEPQ